MVTNAEAREYFATNFNAILERNDVSQGDVARAIKCADEDLQTVRNKVSRYARGISEPTSADLTNIAEYLGTTIDALMAKPRKNSRKSA